MSRPRDSIACPSLAANEAQVRFANNFLGVGEFQSRWPFQRNPVYLGWRTLGVRHPDFESLPKTQWATFNVLQARTDEQTLCSDLCHQGLRFSHLPSMYHRKTFGSQRNN